MRDLSIYIHIPFCVRKCLYCDFLSFPVCEGGTYAGDMPERDMAGKSGAKADETGNEIESYVNYLMEEIKQQSILYKNHRVISIFFGGGTPSLLGTAQVGRIMEQIRTHYMLSETAEITMEMNPGTVTEEKLREYITYGINRVSIGLQSANNEELVRIGRIHDYETFLDTYHAARKVGFTNINIDLMSALPGQSTESYHNTLECVTALKPEHISAYSLILEEGTPLYERQDSYSFPSEEEDRQMYLMTGRYLSEHGYHRYEISNYAREGYECRHNKVYWQRGDYVGFGLGAASMVEECRWSNPSDRKQYKAYVQTGCGLTAEYAGQMKLSEASPTGQVKQPDCPQRHLLTVPEQMEEFMFLGLRMMCGVEREAFYQKFGRQIEEVYGDVLKKLYAQELLRQEHGSIRLTERGIDISNYVMAEFLFD